MENVSNEKARTFRTSVASIMAAACAGAIAACVMAGASPGVAQESPNSPGTTVPESGGIEILNYYRDLAGVSPVTENAVWSAEGMRHAEYIVKTGQGGHSEDPNSPHYTPEGDRAAGTGNVVSSPGIAGDRAIVESWASGPFHALAMIDPRLTKSSYAVYTDPNSTSGLKTGAVLDVSRGNPGGEFGDTVTEPVLFPAQGKVSPLTVVSAYERPSPLVSCGYTAPAGAPTIAMMPEPEDGRYTYEIRDSQGNVLEACAYDATQYDNPDSGAQYTGRYHLERRNAIVIIPRQPLRGDETYTAAIRTCSREVEWSYGVSYFPETYTPGAGVDISLENPAGCDEPPVVDPDPEEPTDPEPPVVKPNAKPVITGAKVSVSKAPRTKAAARKPRSVLVSAVVRDKETNLQRGNIAVRLDGKTLRNGVVYRPGSDRLTVKTKLRKGPHAVVITAKDAKGAVVSRTMRFKVK